MPAFRTEIRGFREPHVGVTIDVHHLHMTPEAALALAELVDVTEPGPDGNVPVLFVDSWTGHSVGLQIPPGSVGDLAQALRNAVGHALGT